MSSASSVNISSVELHKLWARAEEKWYELLLIKEREQKHEELPPTVPDEVDEVEETQEIDMAPPLPQTLSMRPEPEQEAQPAESTGSVASETKEDDNATLAYPEDDEDFSLRLEPSQSQPAESPPEDRTKRQRMSTQGLRKSLRRCALS